jgi:hypothetical protein
MKENHAQLGIKISALPYKENEKIINLPLYSTLQIKRLMVNYLKRNDTNDENGNKL